VWAAQYDRGLKDVFAVQEEMTRRVAGHVAGILFWGETSRLSMDATANPEAYDMYLRAPDLNQRLRATWRSELAVVGVKRIAL